MLLSLRWTYRSKPLIASAAIGIEETAKPLANRLLYYLKNQEETHYQCAANAQTFLILAKQDVLPWVDGVIYLGYAPQAPHLLIPTHQQPHIHPLLLQTAILGKLPAQTHLPVVFLPDTMTLMAAGDASLPQIDNIQQWLNA